MVFPYVTAAEFDRHVPLDPADIQLTDSEYSQAAEDVLQSESERVETDEYAGVNYRDVASTDEVPELLKEAVIRLARARLYSINSDALESEGTGDSASYTYRTLAEVRAEVRSDLQGADLPGTGGNADDDGSFRTALL